MIGRGVQNKKYSLSEVVPTAEGLAMGSPWSFVAFPLSQGTAGVHSVVSATGLIIYTSHYL